MPEREMAGPPDAMAAEPPSPGSKEIVWGRARKLGERLLERGRELGVLEGQMGLERGGGTLAPDAIGLAERCLAAAERVEDGADVFEWRLRFCATAELCVVELERARARVPALYGGLASSDVGTRAAGALESVVGEKHLRAGVEGGLRHLVSAQARASTPPAARKATVAFETVGDELGYTAAAARLLDETLPRDELGDTLRARAARGAIGARPVAAEWRRLADQTPIATMGTLRGLYPAGERHDVNALAGPHQAWNVSHARASPHIMYDASPLFRGRGAEPATVDAGVSRALIETYASVLEAPGAKNGGGGGASVEPPAPGTRTFLSEDGGRSFRAAGRALDPPPTPAHVIARNRRVWEAAISRPDAWDAAADPAAPREAFSVRYETWGGHGRAAAGGVVAADLVVREAVAGVAKLVAAGGVDVADPTARTLGEEAAAADALAVALFEAAARGVVAASKAPPRIPTTSQELALATIAQYESARRTLVFRLRQTDPKRDFPYRLTRALEGSGSGGVTGRRVIKRQPFRPLINLKMAYLLGSV
jgi:hypothetical protein